MNPVTVTTTISRPREEVFDYLCDIANLSEFTDHFLTDWHLTREQSRGDGAGARFRIGARFNRFDWGDLTYVDVEPPHRIVARGRSGKMNRVRGLVTIDLSPGPSGSTKFEWTWETVPATISDRLMERLSGSGWFRRRMKRAARRLRAILEENRDRGTRVTVAGR